MPYTNPTPRQTKKPTNENAPPSTGATTPRVSQSFLDRVAEASRRRSEQHSSRGERADLPSEHVEHCSFRPVITQSAHARRTRSVVEMSTGEQERRLRALEAKRNDQANLEDNALTFQPHINEVPGVQSRLKVTSEPTSYLARVSSMPADLLSSPPSLTMTMMAIDDDDGSRMMTHDDDDDGR